MEPGEDEMPSKIGVRGVVVPDEQWRWAESWGKGHGLSISAMVRLGLSRLRADIEAGEAVLPAVASPVAPQPPREVALPPAPKPVPAPIVPVVEEAPYPAGFTVDWRGNGTWVVDGVRYHFPPAKRGSWRSAIQMIEELGSPRHNPEAWEGVSSEILAWLQPRPA